MRDARGVDNGAIWQGSNPDYVLFQSEGIAKRSFPVNELLKSRDHVVGNLPLGVYFRCENEWLACSVTHRRHRPFKKGSDEDAEAVAAHGCSQTKCVGCLAESYVA